MSFFEIPYLEGVTFVSRTAQVFPDTKAGTVSGRASFRFENTSGQEQKVAFGVNPGYTVSDVRANGAEAPFTVSAYQEYNEALLEVTLPADGEAIPRRASPPCRGARSSAPSTSAWRTPPCPPG